MHRLLRLARSLKSLPPLTVWGCLALSCSAGGGQSQTTEANAAGDREMRTANGQIIRDPAAASEAPSGGDGSGTASSTGTVGQGAEVLGDSDLALNRPDAGPGAGDDDETPDGPAASPDPVAPPPEASDDDEDDDD